MPFSHLGLSAKVLAAIKAAGYKTPTPIQDQAIPHVLMRRDVLGIAQTGTGKTAAFVWPMLTMLEKGRARARMPRTLILEPTRELDAQVAEHFEKYGKNHKLNVALIIGGVSFDDQDSKLLRGVDVLIATPGRLLDHFERGRLLLSGCELLIIDEADRMLDMGFIPDIERIGKLVPFTRQTLFFTATMPPEIQRIADTFLHNPVRVEVAKPATTAATITQLLVKTGRDPHEKRETLRRLIRSADNFKNAIIFCNRKREVANLHRSLLRHKFNAVALHGDMDQPARMAALDQFRRGEVELLIASDVAARGLDIPEVSHIFNFDVPHHPDDYVHRIGRTGRKKRYGDHDCRADRQQGRRCYRTSDWPDNFLDGQARTFREFGRDPGDEASAPKIATSSAWASDASTGSETKAASKSARPTTSRGRQWRPLARLPTSAGFGKSLTADLSASLRTQPCGSGGVPNLPVVHFRRIPSAPRRRACVLCRTSLHSGVLAMTGRTEDYERTTGFAEIALGQMKALRHANSPRNYEIWYTYATGYHPALNAQINSMLKTNGTIAESDLAQIYENYLSPSRLTERLDAVGSQVKAEIDQVMAMIDAVAGTASSYTESLAGASQQLALSKDREGLRVIVENLVATTKAMERSNQQLETRLNASKKEINDLQTSLEAVRTESLTDPLTHLANPKYSDVTLEKAIAESAVKNEPMSLMMTDVDHFKAFNDSFGHLTGDQVLRLVAMSVKNNVKGKDTAARYGGEEFAVVLPNTVLRAATTVADHIRREVMSKELMKRSTGEKLGHVTISIGVATVRNGDTPQSLIERADACLYAAKRNGRNRVICETDPEVAPSNAPAQVA